MSEVTAPSGSLLDLLFEDALEARCLVAPDGRVLRANGAWLRSTGRSPDEVLGVDALDLLPERRHLDSTAHARARAGERVELPRHARLVQGRETWWEGSVAPVPVEGGVGLLLRAREVPAGDALPNASELYERLFQHSREGVLLAQPDGTILRANAAACAALRMTEQQIVAAGRRGIVVPDDRIAAMLAERDRVGIVHGEVRFRRADGTTFPAALTATSLPLANGERRAFVIFRDVTDRQRADLALRASEERLRLFVENVPAAVAMFDRDMRYLAVSRRFLSDYRVPTKDVLGRSHYEVFPEIPERWKEIHRRCLAGAVEACDEEPFPRADGTVDFIQWEIHPWRTAAGEIGGILIFSEVITRRKLAEEALRESDQRKTEFLAVLSHELRNPLAPICNSIYLLERASPGTEQATRAQQVLRRQAEHLTRLVDDLLDVTRISRGKLHLQRTAVDLRDVVAKTTDDVRSLFEECSVALRVERSPRPVRVHGDPTRLAQILGNLLNNALKFTPAGGAVTVAVLEEEGQAKLSVRDTGAGMEPDQVERMFDPFAQGAQGMARSKGGLGLGLALVRGIVAQHGGAVRASSAGLGRGSEFVVTLPVDATQTAPPSPAEPARDRPGRRVLVVEDNVDAGHSLAEILELDGHQVSLARDGRSGFALARELRPDVILCDIGLPDMDGYEFARAARREPALERTRLIALTGYAQPEDRERASAAGFDAHVAKPPSLERLDDLIRGAG